MRLAQYTLFSFMFCILYHFQSFAYPLEEFIVPTQDRMIVQDHLLKTLNSENGLLRFFDLQSGRRFGFPFGSTRYTPILAENRLILQKNDYSFSVFKIDVENYRLVLEAEIDLDHFVHHAHLFKDYIFAVHQDTGFATVVSLENPRPPFQKIQIGKGLEPLAANNRFLFVANFKKHLLSFFNWGKFDFVKTLYTLPQNPWSMASNEDYLVMTHYHNNRLTIIDPETEKITYSDILPKNEMHVVLNQHFAYLTDVYNGPSDIVIVDIRTGEVVYQIAVPKKPQNFAFGETHGFVSTDEKVYKFPLPVTNEILLKVLMNGTIGDYFKELPYSSERLQSMENQVDLSQIKEEGSQDFEILLKLVNACLKENWSDFKVHFLSLKRLNSPHVNLILETVKTLQEY